MMNPWDAWMRGEKWQTRRSPGPAVARYRVHACPYCAQFTSRDTACSKCLTTRFALDFHHLREEVRNGLRSDWPLLPHVQHQIDHTCRAHTIPALTYFDATMARAEAHGFTFDGTRDNPPAPPLFYFYPDDKEYTQ
jgi:hypothetical protein